MHKRWLDSNFSWLYWSLCIWFPFTGTDDEQQDYQYLNTWGPRFDKLANMYGPEREHTDLNDLN